MSIAQNNGLNGVLPQVGDGATVSSAPLDPDNLSSNWLALDPSSGLDGSDPELGAASSTLITADGSDTQSAIADMPNLARPITLASIRQVTTPDSDSSLGASALASGPSDATIGTLAGAPAAGPGDGFGAAAGAAGPADVDLFARAPGGSGGGGHGGSPPPPSTLTNNNGLTFIIDWDSSVGNAPSGFMAGFKSAVQYFLNNFSDAAHPTTITLDVGWGEVGGSRLGFGVLGESATNINRVDFASLQNALLSNLPAGDGPQRDPVSATPHSYWAPSAEEKALGLILDNTTLDGSVGFSSSAKWNFTSTTQTGQYDFVSVAEHEISETMGRIGLGGATVSDSGVNYPNSYSPFDLYRFSDVNLPAPASSSTAYFSYNNGTDSGTTNLAGSPKTFFNTTAGGDSSDWATSAGNDAYNAFSGTGPLAASNVDKLVMDALGYGKI